MTDFKGLKFQSANRYDRVSAFREGETSICLSAFDGLYRDRASALVDPRMARKIAAELIRLAAEIDAA